MSSSVEICFVVNYLHSKFASKHISPLCYYAKRCACTREKITLTIVFITLFYDFMVVLWFFIELVNSVLEFMKRLFNIRSTVCSKEN